MIITQRKPNGFRKVSNRIFIQHINDDLAFVDFELLYKKMLDANVKPSIQNLRLFMELLEKDLNYCSSSIAFEKETEYSFLFHPDF